MTMTPNRDRSGQRGMTLIEVMISLTVMGMMLVSIWSGFKGTIKGMEVSEEIQFRYSTVRGGMSRMVTELSMAYLSFNRPLDDEKHYTLFEGRDGFDADSVTFSAFAHQRIRKDTDESDQSVIQYFVEEDPDDKSRSHLYRRESRRLTGDRPEALENFFPAYVLIEDVVKFDMKYWDPRDMEWRDEWATMRVDMQPDRLPERIKIILVIRDGDDEVEFHNQVVPLMQEKIDLSKNASK
ncbi:MAG: prepilin-type N-terminal cleavage/methylation domain-containing protein [Nannocystaceae bacterium]|nr:prepilin-type N-terminal cleavage/methylation domain-containing protein [Nannocystaceae bacterium]